MRSFSILSAVLLAAACSGGEPSTKTESKSAETAIETPAPAPVKSTAEVSQLQMYMLDCGLIEISDLDGFSSAGDYAGQADTFTDTCWLLRHPDGDLLWDLGLPTGLVGGGQQNNGVFTLSMERTLTDQLVEIGMFASDVDIISISHSHFDHTGQAGQFQSAKWLVHSAEYAAMFPAATDPGDEAGDSSENDESRANPFIDFASLDRQEFTGEHDVFGDGSVIILPTPGHTPGHTALLVNLPEAGPILLTGDLYHRHESRALKRVPRFNSDEAETLRSMGIFEARATAIGARVIIQHEMDDIADLPKAPRPIR